MSKYYRLAAVLSAALLSLVPLRGADAAKSKLTVLYKFNRTKGDDPTGPLLRDAQGNLYGALESGDNKYNHGSVYMLDTNKTATYLWDGCSAKRGTCSDGGDPTGPLIADSLGNLYGTALVGGVGGPAGPGVVFELSPPGQGSSSWTQKVLYAFAGQPDGRTPNGGLVMDAQGNLWGTTQSGGAKGGGTIFEIATGGAESVVYSFPAGAEPLAGLTADSAGNLYGTDSAGGAYGNGEVFEWAANGTETSLYSFCPSDNCPDGYGPTTPVTLDSEGNIYGTTRYGGKKGFGTVYEISGGGETVLYAFGDTGAVVWPDGGVALDGAGNLYGTTLSTPYAGYGTVFELTPDGTLTVLYSFTGGKDGGNGDDAPTGGLIFDSLGNIYGTTSGGGSHGYGTLFTLPD